MGILRSLISILSFLREGVGLSNRRPGPSFFTLSRRGNRLVGTVPTLWVVLIKRVVLNAPGGLSQEVRSPSAKWAVFKQ